VVRHSLYRANCDTVIMRTCGLRRIDMIEGQKSFNENFDGRDVLTVLRCLVAFIREFECYRIVTLCC
jgi:hypothetical protein